MTKQTTTSTTNKTTIPPVFKTAYQPSQRYYAPLHGKSLTHQSMAAECDINTIMKKYEKTGVLEHRNRFEGAYGDFSNVPESYHESMNAVIAAEEMFSTLPARVRRRFHNDPGAFIDFATNPDHAQDMIDLGLATARETQGSSEAVIEPPANPKPAPQAAPTGSTTPS